MQQQGDERRRAKPSDRGEEGLEERQALWVPCTAGNLLRRVRAISTFVALRISPHPSADANPATAPRRSVNLMKWKCHIPGKPETNWAGGFYPLTMEFTDDYPTKPPKVGPTSTACPTWELLASSAQSPRHSLHMNIMSASSPSRL